MGREFESHHRLKMKSEKTQNEEELGQPKKEDADPLLKELAMPRSRLNRSLIQQSKKNIIFAALGIIGIALFLIFFGMPLLVNLSLLFERSSGEDTQQITELGYISPPVLESTFSATNSAKVTIAGETEKNKTVILYRNNEKIAEVNSDEDGSFEFSNADLESGENIIRAKTKDNKIESDYSEELVIHYLKEPPMLEIEQPTQGREYKNAPINVIGTTDAKAKVRINGFWAIVDTEGKFSYSLPLQNGDNKVKVTASDDAGNTTEKEITVTYSP